MIAALVPPMVATAEAFGDPAHAQLLPTEEPAVARAVERRRREFTTGRWCARQALSKLGEPAAAIPRGYRGEPRWPNGFVGSITHCEGYRAAAVGPKAAIRSIGIDAEPDQPLPEGVLNVTTLPEERSWINRQPPTETPTDWGRLLFSAKESVYKAWYPITGRWLGFEDARITFHSDGTFQATLLVDASELSGSGLHGRFAIHRQLILTTVVVMANHGTP